MDFSFKKLVWFNDFKNETFSLFLKINNLFPIVHHRDSPLQLAFSDRGCNLNQILYHQFSFFILFILSKLNFYFLSLKSNIWAINSSTTLTHLVILSSECLHIFPTHNRQSLNTVCNN